MSGKILKLDFILFFIHFSAFILATVLEWDCDKEF